MDIRVTTHPSKNNAAPPGLSQLLHKSSANIIKRKSYLFIINPRRSASSLLRPLCLFNAAPTGLLILGLMDYYQNAAPPGLSKHHHKPSAKIIKSAKIIFFIIDQRLLFSVHSASLMPPLRGYRSTITNHPRKS